MTKPDNIMTVAQEVANFRLVFCEYILQKDGKTCSQTLMSTFM
jgi:hypothetical protein